jgi:hypothetical protein
MKKQKKWNVVKVYEKDYARATGLNKEVLYTGLTFENAEQLRQCEEYNIEDGVAYYCTETN